MQYVILNAVKNLFEVRCFVALSMTVNIKYY